MWGELGPKDGEITLDEIQERGGAPAAYLWQWLVQSKNAGEA